MRYFINSILVVFFIMPGMLKAQENAPVQTINPLKIQRTYTKDLFGYSQEEIDAAKKFLTEKLYPTRDMWQAKIKLLTNTLKEPLKEGYDQITLAELKQAKEQLKGWNEQIKDYKIIAGLASSTFTRVTKYALSGAVLAGVAVLGASYYWGYGIRDISQEINHLKFDVYHEGGLLGYLRNHLIGEPYNIKQPNELEFWDISVKEWKPVIGNEELAKHLPLRVHNDLMNWGYWNADDESKGRLQPIRGGFVFWDEKMGVYRMPTHAEGADRLFYHKFYDKLFDKLFEWPKYRAAGLME